MGLRQFFLGSKFVFGVSGASPTISIHNTLCYWHLENGFELLPPHFFFNYTRFHAKKGLKAFRMARRQQGSFVFKAGFPPLKKKFPVKMTPGPAIFLQMFSVGRQKSKIQLMHLRGQPLGQQRYMIKMRVFYCLFTGPAAIFVLFFFVGEVLCAPRKAVGRPVSQSAKSLDERIVSAMASRLSSWIGVFGSGAVSSISSSSVWFVLPKHGEGVFAEDDLALRAGTENLCCCWSRRQVDRRSHTCSILRIVFFSVTTTCRLPSAAAS